jgi:hypothetical protein
VEAAENPSMDEQKPSNINEFNISEIDFKVISDKKNNDDIKDNSSNDSLLASLKKRS